MFLSIKELEVKKIQFDLVFPPGEIDFLSDGLSQVTPLSARGVAELLGNTLGEVRIQGQVAVSLERPCDRCLEPTQAKIEAAYDLFYRPVENGPEQAEMEIDEGESEMGFYEGLGIDLREVLREFVLLQLPLQMVCRPDCLGLCPVCGENRNQQACHCAVKPVDERWAALRSLRTGTQ